MSWQDFQQTQILHGDERQPAFEKEIVLTAAGNSDWYIVPDKIKIITMTLSFIGGASGKMQTTTDKVYTIKEGVPTPIDWPFGVVSVDQSRACMPVSGIRAVQVGSGTMKVTMRAQ